MHEPMKEKPALEPTELVLARLVDLIRERIAEAAEVAKAAKQRIDSGDVYAAVNLTLSMDETIHRLAKLSEALVIVSREAVRK